MSDTNLESWIAKTQKLIKLDYEEELEQNRVQCEKYSLKALEKSGFAIRKLVVTNTRIAFGRQLYQLAVPEEKKEEINLTTFGIGNGDIVIVTTQSETGSKLSGVVLKMGRTNLEVAFDPSLRELEIFDQAEYFNLIKIANDVTYRRLKATVDDMYKYSLKTYLIRMLFDNEPLLEPLTVLPPYEPYLAEEANVNEDDGIVWFNQNLNESQREAISFALHQRHLAVIHGPPGTGKTTTLTEVILQLVTRRQKVFCFAPSNVAVDNIFKQLLNASQALCSRFKLKKPFNFVRLGHPARVDDQLKNYALDQVVMHSDSSVVSDLRAELDQKMKSGGGGWSSRARRGELKELRQQIAQYESKAFKESLKDADVIFATLTSATLNGQLKYLVDGFEGGRDAFMFDVAIVDECAQALEVAAWIPLSHAKKCILAGDHQQLPATVVSQTAQDQGLGISLIERVVHNLYASCPGKVIRMLTIQYRMNHLIMDWPSEFFYQGRLIASESVRDRRLLPSKLGKTSEPLPVIRLIDTIGCDMYELELDDSLSKGNKYEADIVCLYIRSLLDAGIAPTEIGVISPYRLQTSMIEARCRQQYSDSICNNLEINSVDAFQGREKEVIILSLVRSNDQCEIGFLIEQRRLNVAITRARSHLVVIADSGTVTKESKALESFIDYCYTHADIISAADYLVDMEQFDDLKIELKGKTTTASSKEATKNQKKERKNRNYNKKDPIKAKIPLKNVNLETSKTNRLTPEQIRQQLETFMGDNDNFELKLPETLNSFERRMVHEICDEFGLTHESVGEHPNRQLIITKSAN